MSVVLCCHYRYFRRFKLWLLFFFICSYVVFKSIFLFVIYDRVLSLLSSLLVIIDSSIVSFVSHLLCIYVNSFVFLRLFVILLTFFSFFETYGRLIKKYPDKILKHMTSYHAFFTTLFFIINIYKHERPLRREKWISWPYLTLTSLTPLDCLTSWPPWHLQDDKNYFRSEAALLQQLHHPRVVLMMGVCTTAARPFMLLEYLAGGTLYNLIHNSPWVEGAVFIFFHWLFCLLIFEVSLRFTELRPLCY